MTGLVLPLVFVAVALTKLTARLAFTRERRIKRALRRVKPTPIRDARDGKAVKLVGELVYAGPALQSPLTQRTCAYYSIVVEERGVVPNYRGGWQEILREEKWIDFYLRDDSGMALVRIAGAGMVLPALRRDRIRRNDAGFERFWTERRRRVKGLLFRRSLRIHEAILEGGARVAVGGLAHWIPDPAAAGGNYRETPKRLVLEASGSLPLFLMEAL